MLLPITINLINKEHRISLSLFVRFILHFNKNIGKQARNFAHSFPATYKYKPIVTKFIKTKYCLHIKRNC